MNVHIKALFAAQDRWLDERDLRYKQLFAEKDLRDQQRFDAQQRSITDALQASNTRLDGMNEFRRTIEDLMNLTMSKAEAGPQFAALREKVGELTDRMNRGMGGWSVAVIILGVAVGISGAVAAIIK